MVSLLIICTVGHQAETGNLKTDIILLSGKVPCRNSQAGYQQLVLHHNAPRGIAALRRYGMLPSAA